MKLTAIILSLVLLCLTVRGDGQICETKVCPSCQEKMGLVELCFVMGCVAAGGWIIWKVHGCVPAQHSPVTFVLEKSRDYSTWAPVATNTVILNGSNVLEVFSVQINKDNDDLAMYRARWLKDASHLTQ